MLAKHSTEFYTVLFSQNCYTKMFAFVVYAVLLLRSWYSSATVRREVAIISMIVFLLRV